jgi:hypothetical protein
VLRWPMWRLLCMGFLLSLYNVVQTVSIAGLGPRFSNLVTILNQMCIPVSAVMSACILHRPITWVQLAGLVCVCSGILVAFLPHVISFGNSSSSTSSSGGPLQLEANANSSGSGVDGGASSSSDVTWAMLFTASTVPQSFLSIWTEWLIAADSRRTHSNAAGEAGVLAAEEEGDESPEFGLFDVLCLIGVENVVALPFNAILGLCFLSPEALWADYIGGWACLIGPNACVGAAFASAIFAPLGVLYMVVNYVLIQYGGALMYFLVIAATVCLCNFVLSDVAIMGAGLAGTFYPSVAAGLAIVVVGLVIYADPSEFFRGSVRMTAGKS